MGSCSTLNVQSRSQWTQNRDTSEAKDIWVNTPESTDGVCPVLWHTPPHEVTPLTDRGTEVSPLLQHTPSPTSDKRASQSDYEPDHRFDLVSLEFPVLCVTDWFSIRDLVDQQKTLVQHVLLINPLNHCWSKNSKYFLWTDLFLGLWQITFSNLSHFID